MTIISNHQQLLRFTGMVLLMIDMRRNTGYGGPQYIDGDDLREQAVALGLLELRTIDSPCRPSCACDRFPAQCYFLTPLGEQAVAEMDAPPDDADLPTLASFEGVAPNAVLVDAIGDTTTPAQLLDERDRLRAEVDAADQAATERACAAVCVLCRHGNIWLPALEDEKSGFWLHQHSNPNSHQGPTVCDATSIREAAAKAKAQP